MRRLSTRRGESYSLPLFLPVFQPNNHLVSIDRFVSEFSVEGCIVNAFFLYKQRDIRELVKKGLTLRDHLDFDGFLVTDSGAFQGFSGPLYLSNRKIVAFQDAIRTDVASPLDLITPPGDSRHTAEWKWETTRRRIQEMLPVVQHCRLAGVQQGGRFPDLRRRSAEALAEMGVEYVAIGSLVPFFNRRHDLTFVGEILRDARQALGSSMPIHVYGAGDPLELPFMVKLGADIFDSSSYAHYAVQGWYMTEYGALRVEREDLIREVECPCPFCGRGTEGIGGDAARLAAHNLWTITAVISGVRRALAEGSLDGMLAAVLDRHRRVFPDSLLPESWERLHE
ncbi:tRNA-guanine transglycosylase [bacterium]|nr:tRNA-guanine transglycosylase [candidate division CSSED10-310 bacterium]